MSTSVCLLEPVFRFFAMRRSCNQTFRSNLMVTRTAMIPAMMIKNIAAVNTMGFHQGETNSFSNVGSILSTLNEMAGISRPPRTS